MLFTEAHHQTFPAKFKPVKPHSLSLQDPVQ
jgi:hypothetical protein